MEEATVHRRVLHHAHCPRVAAGQDGFGIVDGLQPRGDLIQRLVPGDALELALAALADALQRMGDPVRRIVAMAPAGSLLAAHRIHVGNARLDRGEAAGLLLAHDAAVLHVDPPRAAARVAVDGMASPRHRVPGPALAVGVCPASVSIDRPTRRAHGALLPKDAQPPPGRAGTNYQYRAARRRRYDGCHTGRARCYSSGSSSGSKGTPAGAPRRISRTRAASLRRAATRWSGSVTPRAHEAPRCSVRAPS